MNTARRDNDSHVSRQKLRALQQSLAEHLTSQKHSHSSFTETTLAHLNTHQLESARETLVRKRRAQTAAILPRTVDRMGRQFDLDFRDFATNHHFNGSKAIWKDAIAFACWKGSHVGDDPFLGELLVWEGLLAQWHSRLPFFRLRTIRWDLLHSDSGPSERPLLRSRRLVLAWRWRGWGAFLCL